MTSSELKNRLTEALILLSIPGVGRARYRRLVEHFGSPSAVMQATKSSLESVPDIGSVVAASIRAGVDGSQARQSVARIVQLGWTVLFAEDADYPHLLANTPDRPPILFRLGEAPAQGENVVAIVGTRHASESGRLFTKQLATDASRAGLTVVSGMAEGIDSAAHHGALEGGGRTIAVWGTSLDVIYPPSNKSLAGDILRNGAIYSEYPPGTQPDKTTFPERNRIISGMSDAVVVVEAGFRSGALITARFALDQGRELFSVPGPPRSKLHEGTNNLIRKGANLLTGVDDIFEQLPRLRGAVTSQKFRALPDISDMERKMVDLLADGPQQIDQLSRQAELPVPELLGFMLALEMKGLVQELSGKRFVLTD